MDNFSAVGRGCESAEFVVALGITEVARHVCCVADVARRRQATEGGTGGVSLVGDPRVQVGPRGAALKAVLHTHVLQILELTVEVGKLHLQLSILALGVQHWLTDGQVDGRRRWLEMDI